MRRLISSGSVAMSKPTTRPVPPVGSRIPHSMRMVVDLPAPLGPSTPKISPRRTCSETSRTAHCWPKRRDSRSVSTTSSSAAMAAAPRAIDVDEGGHPGVQGLAGIGHPHPDPDHQVAALALAEQELGGELGAGGDPLDLAGQPCGEGVGADDG